LAMKLHTPENRPKETYDIQNMAKVWYQELHIAVWGIAKFGI
jgi:hypothetical protein